MVWRRRTIPAEFFLLGVSLLDVQDHRMRKAACLPQLWLALLPMIVPSVVEASRPNIIVVMVDDMGFSDIGPYGSEIPTPNLDALAAGGVRFSQFHNTGRCCPTRASLLTGLYSHETGIGWMTADQHTPIPVSCE